ncbi:hypothetical protein P5W92_09820 [Streptomyces sp. J15]|uniref:Uncharacterized protein n=1 Tax=Streptomyces pakalii TaxID=3036494 RepID=A0ABT7D4H1_9ACTN|nr:hypothetical protein [Streptomyces pakalii]MDJ1640704.1 hypothetical protein [Streptomyces pakalii]
MGRDAPGEPLPALFGIAASFAVAALLGLAAGTLARHSAGAVTTVIGLLLLPSLFGPLLGDAERWIAGLSPTAAPWRISPRPRTPPPTRWAAWTPGPPCSWWPRTRRRSRWGRWCCSGGGMCEGGAS